MDRTLAQAPSAQPRLIKVSAAGILLPADATEWVAVYQPELQLTWTRDVLPCGAVPWKKAVAAASKVEMCGWSDWRAPTRLEYAHLIDEPRYAPAIDPAFFTVANSYQWEWTGTPHARSGAAWLVGLGYGYSNWDFHDDHGHVRAVRASQLSWPLESMA